MFEFIPEITPLLILAAAFVVALLLAAVGWLRAIFWRDEAKLLEDVLALYKGRIEEENNKYLRERKARQAAEARAVAAQVQAAMQDNTKERAL